MPFSKETPVITTISKVASEEELLLALQTVYEGGQYIEKRMKSLQKKLGSVDSLFSRRELIEKFQ